MSDLEVNSDLRNAGEAALFMLIPKKSNRQYEKSWFQEKDVFGVTVKVILVYFAVISSTFKSSALWSNYSML